MEQSAASVRQRLVVSRSATPGVLPAAVCGLVDAELHLVWIASVGMAPGRDSVASRRGYRSVLDGPKAGIGVLDSGTGDADFCLTSHSHRASHMGFRGFGHHGDHVCRAR